jgi:hypothetical protein
VLGLPDFTEAEFRLEWSDVLQCIGSGGNVTMSSVTFIQYPQAGRVAVNANRP